MHRQIHDLITAPAGTPPTEKQRQRLQEMACIENLFEGPQPHSAPKVAGLGRKKRRADAREARRKTRRSAKQGGRS